MSTVSDETKTNMKALRSRCRGVRPLDARLEPWMISISQDPEIIRLVEEYGSPLNLLHPSPFQRNVSRFYELAETHGLDFDVYFARKANKCLGFVDASKAVGSGIDVASENELQQVLDCGFSSEKIICTAAIKSHDLLSLCVRNHVTIVIDNFDELEQTICISKDLNEVVNLALRLSGFEFEGEKLHSRFGVDIDEAYTFISENITNKSSLKLNGLHFHLDGYCRFQRAAALSQCLDLAEQLKSVGVEIEFIDIGGGIPMSYLEDRQQWDDFWESHFAAVLGAGESLTYRNHGLGFENIEGKLHGRRSTYPYWQEPVAVDWFSDILDADHNGSCLKSELKRLSIQLRCEPGRSVLDGCGITVAKVVYRKRHQAGYWLIGLAMNRTQCRTSSDDFLVDPILIPADKEQTSEPVEGYLVGAYCTESELLSLRRLRFPIGINVGDLVMFPNTAGYFMHFLESRSHQFPLANNLFHDAVTNSWRQDKIDEK